MCTFLFCSFIEENFPLEKFWDNYRSLFNFFDDWVVVTKSDDKLNFIVRKKEEKHVETIEWQYTDKQFNSCKVSSEFIENVISAMRKSSVSDEQINQILKHINE